LEKRSPHSGHVLTSVMSSSWLGLYSAAVQPRWVRPAGVRPFRGRWRRSRKHCRARPSSPRGNPVEEVPAGLGVGATSRRCPPPAPAGASARSRHHGRPVIRAKTVRLEPRCVICGGGVEMAGRLGGDGRAGREARPGPRTAGFPPGAVLACPSRGHHIGYTCRASRCAALGLTHSAASDGGRGDRGQPTGAGSVADLRSRYRGDLLPPARPPWHFSSAPPGQPVTAAPGWAWRRLVCHPRPAHDRPAPESGQPGYEAAAHGGRRPADHGADHRNVVGEGTGARGARLVTGFQRGTRCP
jgi:hypothetical protein